MQIFKIIEDLKSSLSRLDRKLFWQLMIFNAAILLLSMLLCATILVKSWDGEIVIRFLTLFVLAAGVAMVFINYVKSTNFRQNNEKFEQSKFYIEELSSLLEMSLSFLAEGRYNWKKWNISADLIKKTVVLTEELSKVSIPSFAAIVEARLALYRNRFQLVLKETDAQMLLGHFSNLQQNMEIRHGETTVFPHGVSGEAFTTITRFALSGKIDIHNEVLTAGEIASFSVEMPAVLEFARKVSLFAKNHEKQIEWKRNVDAYLADAS
ncbi:MAG: hypothetical protein ACUZ8H_03965 [Candidatus Anammoxibacter sp.]